MANCLSLPISLALVQSLCANPLNSRHSSLLLRNNCFRYTKKQQWDKYMMLWPEMLRRPGHFLVWSLLPARWMTLLLDCDTITTNQRLERDQTANQLLERIGPHYRAQPITYLAQVRRLYRCLVYFSLSHFLSVFLAVGLFCSLYFHQRPLLFIFLFLCKKQKKRTK